MTEPISELPLKFMVLCTLLTIPCAVIMGLIAMSDNGPDYQMVICDGEEVLKSKHVWKASGGEFAIFEDGDYMSYTPRPGQTCKITKVYND